MAGHKAFNYLWNGLIRLNSLAISNEKIPRALFYITLTILRYSMNNLMCRIVILSARHNSNFICRKMLSYSRFCVPINCECRLTNF